jgi:excisionase family DNA binding protein
MPGGWNEVTTIEAARQLGVSRDAVNRYFHSGILAGRRHGKLILIEQRAVLALQKVIRAAESGHYNQPRGGRDNRPTKPGPAVRPQPTETEQLAGVE